MVPFIARKKSAKWFTKIKPMGCKFVDIESDQLIGSNF